MRPLAGLLVVASFGLGFAGALTLMWFALMAALALYLWKELFA